MGAPPPSPIRVKPFWRILPPGLDDDRAGAVGHELRLTEGAGWGSGAHETTQLCLQAIAHLAPQGRVEGWRLLDFGAGSGLLSIAAARLGAQVDAVEIDEEGLRHGERNAAANGLAHRIRYSRELPELRGYDGVVANILRPVLLEHASALGARVSAGGWLVLSGLLAAETPEVSVRYSGVLGGREPSVISQGDWRALVWWPISSK